MLLSLSLSALPASHPHPHPHSRRTPRSSRTRSCRPRETASSSARSTGRECLLSSFSFNFFPFFSNPGLDLDLDFFSHLFFLPLSLYLPHHKTSKFNDGFPNLFVRDATRIRNRHVAFLASFQSPASIFEQLSIIYQLPRMFVGSFTLVLPYFPTGTAERVEAEGDVATAVTLARILSNIPLSRGGPTSVVIFDIHALQERFYFGDTVLPLFESGIPLLRARLAALPDRDQVTIAYPDEGAWKRFHYQFGDYPEIICTKVRDGAKRIVRLKEGAPRGRHVVIVDDLVQSGGTLLECGKLLALTGASAVSAYATHGVFPQRSFEKFTAPSNGEPRGAGGEPSSSGAAPAANGNGTNDDASTAAALAAAAAPFFKYFWISDSCPETAAAVRGVKPFEVLSLADAIAATLRI